MNKGIQSIEIGFRVIDALVRTRGTVSLKKIAELAGMSPSKTRMYLVSLIRTGIIAQEPQGGPTASGHTPSRWASQPSISWICSTARAK